MNYKHLATEFWSFLDRAEIRLRSTTERRSHQSNASNSVDDFTENKSTSRVVGILDFEFATRDLRLMDYLCGLEHFAQFPWQNKSHWEAVKAFHRGYKQYVSLINLEGVSPDVYTPRPNPNPTGMGWDSRVEQPVEKRWAKPILYLHRANYFL